MSALAGGLALRGAAWYWWAARRHAVETPLYAGPPLALPELGACGRRVNATLPTVACAAAYARRPAAIRYEYRPRPRHRRDNRRCPPW